MLFFAALGFLFAIIWIACSFWMFDEYQVHRPFATPGFGAGFWSYWVQIVLGIIFAPFVMLYFFPHVIRQARMKRGDDLF
jgi:hypothetical protein